METGQKGREENLGPNPREGKTGQKKERDQPRVRTRVFKMDGAPYVPHR